MLYWYEQDKTTAVIKLYADIGWWSSNAQSFTALLEALDAKYTNIIIRVHCYGGLVIEGNAIYNCIAGANASITWRIEGACMSMASIIMLACDSIEMCENATLMIHEPSGGAWGNEKDMLAVAKLLASMKKNAASAYAKKTGMKPAEIQSAYFDGSDHFLDSEEALQLGFIDKVIPAVVKNVKAIPIPVEGDDEDDDSIPVDLRALYNHYSSLLEMREDNEQEYKQGMRITRPRAKATKPVSSKSDINMKKSLIAQYGLQGVDENTPDEQFMAVLNAAIAAKGVTSGQPQSQPATQPAAPADQARANAEAVLSAVEGITGKTFEATQRATLLDIGAKAGIDTMKVAMQMASAAQTPAAAPAAASAAPNVMNLLKGGTSAATGTDSRAGWDWNKWNAEDPNGLEAMAKGDATQQAKYKELYKAEYKTEPDLS